MRILIMGLPGSGKSTFANMLAEELSTNMAVEVFDADVVREQLQDFDFSADGRRRQAERMRDLATAAEYQNIVPICNFICPLPEYREVFDATILVWLDTVKTSNYPDTNTLFVPPTNEAHICIDKFELFESYSKSIADLAWILEE